MAIFIVAPDNANPYPQPGTAVMPTQARHPAVEKGCSRIQIEAFERIVTGDDEAHAPATLAALVSRGLITLRETLLPGVLAVRVKIPVVPLTVHYAWCAWCAEQPDPS